jgi:hypothetical protein
MAQIDWAMGHQKSKTPEKFKLPRRCLWPVTGTCPSTPLYVEVTTGKWSKDNFRVADPETARKAACSSDLFF